MSLVSASAPAPGLGADAAEARAKLRLLLAFHVDARRGEQAHHREGHHDAAAMAPSVDGLHGLSRQEPADLVFALDGPEVVQIRGCSPAQFDAHLADLFGGLIGSREDIPARSGSGSPE